MIAVQDGRIVKVGSNQAPRPLRRAPGRLRQHATPTARLSTARRTPTPCPRPSTVTAGQVDQAELELAAKAGPEADARPPRAGTQAAPRQRRARPPARRRAVARRRADASSKERLFANPDRPRRVQGGGEEPAPPQRRAIAGFTTFKALLHRGLRPPAQGRRRSSRCKVGSQVIAGTILGRIGKTDDEPAPHLHFEIRPAGKGAPRDRPQADPRRLEAARGDRDLPRRRQEPVLRPRRDEPDDRPDPADEQGAARSAACSTTRASTIYDCGRRDIAAGDIDRRVLATLEFLAAIGPEADRQLAAVRPQLPHHVGQRLRALHAATPSTSPAINGIPILGHQGAGSITDITIRRLLTLQGTMKPHQIISLMTFPGTDNTLSLPDHDDHIHVGFRPLYGANAKLGSQLNAVAQARPVDQADRPPRRDRQPDGRRRSRRSTRSTVEPPARAGDVTPRRD